VSDPRQPGLHQSGSGRPEAPPATIVQSIRSIKERRFDALPREIFSLEDLVPEGNFYRRLEAALDLSFVRPHL
jgi:hypothetical protein